MSNFVLECATPGVCTISGSFRPNGSSAISSTHNKGLGWSVAHTSTGLYTVTLTPSIQTIISVLPSLTLVAASNTHVQIQGAPVASTGTFVIANWLSGTGLADVASDAANWINFTVWYTNRSY